MIVPVRIPLDVAPMVITGGVNRVTIMAIRADSDHEVDKVDADGRDYVDDNYKGGGDHDLEDSVEDGDVDEFEEDDGDDDDTIRMLPVPILLLVRMVIRLLMMVLLMDDDAGGE